MVIVAKYGGSSVANKEQIDKVYPLLRDVNVVSAPGADTHNPIKLTSALIEYAQTNKYDLGEKIIDRFESLEQSLGVNINVRDSLASDFNKSFPTQNHKTAFLASRGEHYGSRIIHAYFSKRNNNYELILPEKHYFIMEGQLNNASYSDEALQNMALIKNYLNEGKKLIVPGFYGITRDGSFSVLSRGGSDYTGAVLSSVLNAYLYENFTDGDGIYQVDPRIIPESNVIPLLNYDEARILSSRGFTIFHPEAMIPCKKKEIPIIVKNTNNPNHQGTRIVSTRLSKEDIIGIAKLDGLAYVHIKKDSMDGVVGFALKALDIFASNNINTHHYPTNLDDLTIFVDEKDFIRAGVDVVLKELRRELAPDVLNVGNEIAFLTLVGIGANNRTGIIGRAASALSNAGINIEATTQSVGHSGILFGVKEHNSNRALRVLYDEFFVSKS